MKRALIVLLFALTAFAARGAEPAVAEKGVERPNVIETSFPQLFYPLMTRQFFCDFHEKYEDFCVS